MAEVVLFHHGQGLTLGVAGFAHKLRGAGHSVHTPNLYGRPAFDDFLEGTTHAYSIGLDEMIKRGALAVEEIAAEVVYAGFSMGVLPAQMLAQVREGAKGALLFHNCLPYTAFGSWPAGVPVQVHAMEHDPVFLSGDIENARNLLAHPEAELFLYPGDEHIFTDDSMASYDEEATALLMERVLTFLERC